MSSEKTSVQNDWIFNKNKTYIGGFTDHDEDTWSVCTSCGKITDKEDVYTKQTRAFSLTNKHGYSFTLVVKYTGREECDNCGEKDDDLEWDGEMSGTIKIGYSCKFLSIEFKSKDIHKDISHLVPFCRSGKELAKHIKSVIQNVKECPTCFEYINGECEKCTNRAFIFGTDIVDGIDKCPICLENIRECDLFTTECKHHFHISCMNKHIGNNCKCCVKCPICRQSL